ncbi:MAG: 4-(cytidine 5'-diphospho)-2-C-methyl-D-erythritol kinase [Bacteroidales bacterium]|nr:4-(cytidine 5'-diphospho)-2-C-methyl-D-erythritol kinase [Bacteroidales bacterium]
MTLKTCTKVNVGLNVLRKRPDGYHDLETLFVPYWGLGDELTVEPAEELTIEILREGRVDWDPMDDLTVRAWRLLKADFPALPAVSIRLVKGAPVGAGLGGGSADAAFMLRALNEIGGLGLSDAVLASYAAKLGSDCAFFVYCRPMFATGRGEILEPFDIDLSAYDLKVEIPLDATTGRPVAVSTREAYGGIVPRDVSSSRVASAGIEEAATSILAASPLRLSNAAPSFPSSAETRYEATIPLREALKLPVDQWRGVVVNDFEATVCPLHPEISDLIEDFYRRGAVYAAMSGSGSSVFGIWPKNI